MVSLLVAGALTVVGATSSAADTAPPAGSGLPATVAADALPTVQIDGVVWSQATVGNKVWATGGFTRARPAGSAPGQNEVDRRNILVYDIRTGQRDTTFTEQLNATGQVVAVSPNGSRVYVGGDFTVAGGARHERIVAFDTATGRVVHAFDAHVDQRVSAIAATNDTVYVGGSFLTANGVPRTRLAAFRASDGALLNWAPTAQDQPVQAMALTRDNRTLYVGGKFNGLNGNGIKGLGALDPVTGATKPMPTASTVRNGGEMAGITSLTVDDDTVYGTGFTFGSLAVGNFEGVFAADASNGQLKWLMDCHGDHYSSVAIGGVVYAAGHAHYCGNTPGAFSQTSPWRFDRALALSKDARTTLYPNAMDRSRYFDFGGLPSPEFLHWYPYLDAGTYTGQNQGPWSVTGNSDYVAFGGEFTRANQFAQQGLVRYARRALAPNQIGPQSGAALTPVLENVTNEGVRVAWQSSWEYDNANLTYRVFKDGRLTTPVHEVTTRSAQYDRPFLSWTDPDVQPGRTYSYRVFAYDPLGNANSGSTRTITYQPGEAADAYASRVRADGARHHWRLGESSGTARDWGSGGDDLSVGTGVIRSVAGALSGSQNRAARFGGTSASEAATTGAVFAPQEFTVEAWVLTSSTAGGKIVGFGNRRTGSSNYYDRHLYVDSGGRVSFGVNPGIQRTLRSPASIADNRWHHVVGTLGPNGQRLYVDGQLVASLTGSTLAVPQTGYWRVGGDNLTSWANQPTSNYLNGSIDEVAVYDTALSTQQIAAHHAIGIGQAPANVPPTASFTSQTDVLTASFDASGSSDVDGEIVAYTWSFGDGTTGTGRTVSKTYANAGTYNVTLTVRDNSNATAQRTQGVTVTAPPVNAAPTASFTASVQDLAVTVDASASRDSDGTIVGYAWNFGDGTTGTGPTSSRRYQAPGTYRITLTVTDNNGATATTNRDVTVTAPPAVTTYASDAFGRSLVNGWGLADQGGAWALSGGVAADYSVSGGAGRSRLPSAGATRSVYLTGVSASSTETQVTVAADKAATGGGTYVSVIGRRVSGAGDYRLKLRYLSNGAVATALTRVTTGETGLAAGSVPGTVQAGERLRVRLQVAGTSPTTISAKVWPESASEPADWSLTATDSTGALQVAGHIGMSGYLSGSSTNAPVSIGYDDLWVGTLGGPGD